MSEQTNAALAHLLRYLEQKQQAGQTHIWITPEARGTLRALALAQREQKKKTVSSRPLAPKADSAARMMPAAPAKTVTTLRTTATAHEPVREQLTPRPTRPVRDVFPLASADAPVRAELAALRQKILDDPAYRALITTGQLRSTMVYAVGNPHSPLVFVGEAPGAEEEKMGEPFVGPAGQLLTKMLQAMGLKREDVYITNLVKYRPSMGQDQGVKNRKPSADEMAVGLPHLQAELAVLKPQIIVALGATAAQGLLGRNVSITAERGRWQSFAGIPVMPTYHPSYLLRNQGLTERRQVWEDLLQVMERLQLPISEKQRAFFTV